MPEWGVYISIDQLGYPRASMRDVVRLAETLNRDAALVILGTYNLALSLASVRRAEGGHTSERAAAQTALVRNSISDARLREVKNKLGHVDLVDRPLFHRAQMLTMIKLVAKFGQSSTGNRLQRRSDFDVIAELGLLVNSLWATDYDGGDDPGYLIAPGLAAVLELENPPSVLESMVRASSLLGEHMGSLRIHDKFARRVESTFLFSTGMNFEELLDLTFAVWAYYQSLNIQDLVEDQGRGHLNPLKTGNIISAAHMTTLLDTLAVPFADVPGMPFGNADAPDFLHNHTALRRRPIWRFGEDNYLCIDPAFLQEKLSSGVYWTVMDALSREDADQFARLWGRLFERYLWDLLETIYEPQRIWRSPRYIDNGHEAFDAVIDYGDTLIVCQAKSTFAPAQGKYSSEPTTFFGAMESRFGDDESGALRQLRENLIHCFGLGTKREIEQLRGRRVREILPLVIYQEPILRFGLVTRTFARRLEESLRTQLFKLDLHVRPAIFMHIGDFHLFAQHLREGDVTLVDVLHAKLAGDPTHIMSLDEFWREQFRTQIGVLRKDDEIQAAAWGHYRDESLRRFRMGDYL